jgi:hypothetical protein
MTAANGPKRSGRAAAVLGVPAAAPAAAARAAFLRQLADEQFLPPEPLTAAANVLAGAAVPLTDYGRACEAGLRRDDLRAFAAAYWSLPPADRRARWAELGDGCRHDSEVFRFRRDLEPGLHLAVILHQNPLVEDVAAAIRELFLLGPRERAIRRAAWLAERADRVRDLADAVRRLRTDDPGLAALDPDLSRRLASGVPLAAVSAGRGLERSEEVWAEAVAPTAHRTAQSAPEPASGGINWTAVFVILSALGAILRAVSSGSQSSPPPRPSYTQPYSLPPVPPRNSPDDLTMEQRVKLLNDLRDSLPTYRSSRPTHR